VQVAVGVLEVALDVVLAVLVALDVVFAVLVGAEVVTFEVIAAKVVVGFLVGVVEGKELLF
jgi:hypothetical protein